MHRKNQQPELAANWRNDWNMQILYLLPGVLYGLYLGLSSGNWALLFLTAGSALIWLFAGQRRELEGEISFSGERSYLGYRRLSRVVFLWPAKIRDRVYERVFSKPEVFDQEEFEDLAKTSPWFLGFSAQGPVHLPVGSYGHHGLVIGPTGSGKTQLIRNLAQGPDLEVIGIDFKGGLGFSELDMVRLLTNLDGDSNEFWFFLNRMLDQREAEVLLGNSPKNLLVIADELASILASSLQAQSTIERLVTKGRSLNVVFIGASQTLSGIPRTILANCLLRIIVGAVDPVDIAQLGVIRNHSSHQAGLGKASLIVAGAASSFEFGCLQNKTKKEKAPTEVDANPFLARFDPTPESIHL